MEKHHQRKGTIYDYKKNFEDVLQAIGYICDTTKKIYEKLFPAFDCTIKVDFDKEEIIYPEDRGMRITRKTKENTWNGIRTSLYRLCYIQFLISAFKCQLKLM